MNDQSENNETNPDHYKSASGIEVIDIITAFSLDFLLGNAIKYILRHAKKGNPVTDLRKARWYVTAKLKELGEQEGFDAAHAYLTAEKPNLQESTKELRELPDGDIVLYLQGLMIQAYEQAYRDLGLRFDQSKE